MYRQDMTIKPQRLNKFLAHNTGISRREADNLILSGRVKVDNKVAKLGAQISEKQIVTLDNKLISRLGGHITIIFHKPINYVCSRRQQGESPTVYALLPDKYKKLKLVGRLDRDSSGLILLTDDGDLAHSLLHPSFHKTKVYNVRLDKPLQPLHQQMINDFGINLPDGRSQFSIQKIDDCLQITMTSGRNHQIRRTFAALGYLVTHLHRVAFGPYNLGDLRIGEFRIVKT
jgi:23S rRNA pseudouridine2605 synthase